MDGNYTTKYKAFKENLEEIVFLCFSQKDYVCFDIVPRHHNIIRYRKGLAVIKDDFSHVCSWVQFPNKEEWRYDLFLGKSLTSLYNCIIFLNTFVLA